MHRIFCNILQFNFIYLSHNTNPLPYLKVTEITYLGYYRINLFVGLVFYFNKYPVVGWK